MNRLSSFSARCGPEVYTTDFALCSCGGQIPYGRKAIPLTVLSNGVTAIVLLRFSCQSRTSHGIYQTLSRNDCRDSDTDMNAIKNGADLRETPKRHPNRASIGMSSLTCEGAFDCRTLQLQVPVLPNNPEKNGRLGEYHASPGAILEPK